MLASEKTLKQNNSLEASVNDLIVNKQSFMFVRLILNDLNDNQPKFNETKYTFYINEITENKLYYSEAIRKLDEKNSSNYYYSLLNETCYHLKMSLHVDAYDLDAGLNSIVKYKITHQKHLRNPYTKMSILDMSEENRYIDSFELNSDSIFQINEQTGSIYLRICNLLEDLSYEKVYN